MSRFTSWFKNRKLQVDILTLFSGIFLFSFTFIISFAYISYSKSIQEYAKNFIHEIGETIGHKMGDLLDDVLLILNTAPVLVHTEKEVSLDNENLTNWIFETFALYQKLDGYYFSTLSGTLLEFYKIPENAVYRNDRSKFLNPEIKYALRFIDRRQKEATEVWLYKNVRGETLEIENIENVTFDPRVRPWFLQVQEKDKIFWTEVYQFDETSEPGITASKFLLDRSTGEPFGVIGADMTLRLISETLERNKIGEHGESAIIDDRGAIVARPISAHDDPELFFNSHEHFKKVGEKSFVFDWKKEKYLAVFFDFSPFLGKQWSVSTIVPINELLQQVKKNYQYMIIYSFGIVAFSSVIVILFAKRLSKPIVRLADEANKITELQLDQDIQFSSHIREIHYLVNSLGAVKKAMRSFGRYVPKEIVRELLAQGHEISLSGVRKEVTVFFSSIHGFIDMIESLPVEKLMQQLEEYFSPLSKSILENQGTIDKYIGDSLMAFWGAPIAVPEHSFFACKTALLCQMRLSELNAQWEKENKPILFSSIGIHTGEVVVGTIGTSERMNYTVVGDSVNLASRIDRVGHLYRAKILISDSVVKKIAKYPFLMRPVDVITVVGKQQKIKIYELIALLNDPLLASSKEMVSFCDKFQTAFDLYLTQKWSEALSLFKELKVLFPADFLTQMYIARCEEYIKNPPGKNWEGVTHLQTKG
jgi:adenylate cyclase